MIIVQSPNQIPIRLTAERWTHIITQHPEMATQRDRVLETVSKPELIQAGDFGELLAIRFYSQTPLTQKYLVVAYRETTDDDFILTAYLACRPSARRQTVWTQSQS
jgi:hypothetical protein